MSEVQLFLADGCSTCRLLLTTGPKLSPAAEARMPARFFSKSVSTTPVRVTWPFIYNDVDCGYHFHGVSA